MKKTNMLLLVCCGILTACSAADEAMFDPEASYLNDKVVSSVPKSQSITVVGSMVDETGNYLPAYPYPMYKKAHKIVHLSPVPTNLTVRCEAESVNSGVHGGLVRSKRYATTTVNYPFQAGKTYQIFCNLQIHNNYKVVVREVPDGTKFQTVRSADFKTNQPNDSNRVRFEITGKSSRSFWRLAGNEYMAVRNWDGKLGETAELAAPLNSVTVECQTSRDRITVPLTGNFQAGKTYRLACRKNAQGLVEAYVAESK